MNVLILDVNDKLFIQTLKQNKRLSVLTGTIDEPVLFPIPDVIITDFDYISADNKRETILIELASKLHPQVKIIACSEGWNSSTKQFARWFGADRCIYTDRLDILAEKLIFEAKPKIFSEE